MLTGLQQQRLEQVVIEDRYCKKNIREKVLLEINEAATGALLPVFQKANTLIMNWLKEPALTRSGKPWRLRQMWKDHLLNLDHKNVYRVAELVVEMCYIILPESYAQSIQSVAGRLAQTLEQYCPESDVFERVQICAELLAVACDSDLYNIIPAQDSETGSILIKSNYQLPEHILQFIADTKYLPPMITPPNPVKSNWNKTRMSFSESIILKPENHHMYQQNLVNLNTVNQIPLSIDMNMVQYEETSSKDLDTPEKVLNFNRLKSTSRDVYNEILAHGNIFYLTWKYDKRGREYSQGYHLHIQASDYKKSLINFAKEEVVNC